MAAQKNYFKNVKFTLIIEFMKHIFVFIWKSKNNK